MLSLWGWALHGQLLALENKSLFTSVFTSVSSRLCLFSESAPVYAVGLDVTFWKSFLMPLVGVRGPAELESRALGLRGAGMAGSQGL